MERKYRPQPVHARPCIIAPCYGDQSWVPPASHSLDGSGLCIQLPSKAICKDYEGGEGDTKEAPVSPAGVSSLRFQAQHVPICRNCVGPDLTANIVQIHYGSHVMPLNPPYLPELGQGARAAPQCLLPFPPLLTLCLLELFPSTLSRRYLAVTVQKRSQSSPGIKEVGIPVGEGWQRGMRRGRGCGHGGNERTAVQPSQT